LWLPTHSASLAAATNPPPSGNKTLITIIAARLFTLAYTVLMC